MSQRELRKMVFFHRFGFSLWDASNERVAELGNLFPDIEFLNLADPQDLAKEIHDADAVCSMRVTPQLFRAAQRLKWIHSLAAGVGGLMIPEVLAGDVLITNARGLFSTVIAEHALGVILSFSRRLPDSLRFQQQHHWAREELWALEPKMGEISGKALGIVGYGSIGQAIAKRARAFGMTVLAVKKSLSTGTEFADRVFPLSHLHEVLRQSDFVVLALPHTPDTKQVMGRREFETMKPTAYLINVGRGKLIDEAALLQALQEKRLAGAALDVFETEPLLPDHPLWDAPNVLITPHSSGNFPEFWARSRDLIAENIRLFREGKPLKNLVDKKRGY
jgi:phosphoglycerate dehydrogenase-like enzyme